VKIGATRRTELAPKLFTKGQAQDLDYSLQADLLAKVEIKLVSVHLQLLDLKSLYT
jgi:hypothetical protein